MCPVAWALGLPAKRIRGAPITIVDRGTPWRIISTGTGGAGSNGRAVRQWREAAPVIKSSLQGRFQVCCASAATGQHTSVLYAAVRLGARHGIYGRVSTL